MSGFRGTIDARSQSGGLTSTAMRPSLRETLRSKGELRRRERESQTACGRAVSIDVTGFTPVTAAVNLVHCHRNQPSRLIPGGRTLQSGLRAARGSTRGLRDAAGRFRTRINNPGVAKAGDVATKHGADASAHAIVCGG